MTTFLRGAARPRRVLLLLRRGACQSKQIRVKTCTSSPRAMRPRPVSCATFARRARITTNSLDHSSNKTNPRLIPLVRARMAYISTRNVWKLMLMWDMIKSRSSGLILTLLSTTWRTSSLATDACRREPLFSASHVIGASMDTTATISTCSQRQS